MNRHLLIVMLSGLLLSGAAFAQPASSRADGEDRRPYRRRWDERRWEEAAAFLQDHSPRRWAAYEALPEGQKDRVRSAILRRHVRMERIREHSPEDVYEIIIRRIELEDEAWALGQRIRDTSDPAASQELRKQLETVVEQIVQEQLREREQRIERLKKAVEREEKHLADDRRDAAEQVQRQIERIIATDNPMIDPGAPPGSDEETDPEGGQGERVRRRGRGNPDPQP